MRDLIGLRSHYSTMVYDCNMAAKRKPKSDGPQPIDWKARNEAYRASLDALGREKAAAWNTINTIIKNDMPPLKQTARERSEWNRTRRMAMDAYGEFRVTKSPQSGGRIVSYTGPKEGGLWRNFLSGGLTNRGK